MHQSKAAAINKAKFPIVPPKQVLPGVQNFLCLDLHLPDLCLFLTFAHEILPTHTPGVHDRHPIPSHHVHHRGKVRSV